MALLVVTIALILSLCFGHLMFNGSAMPEVNSIYLIVASVWVLKFIDDAIDAKIETVKNKPLFNTEQRLDFASVMLAIHLAGFQRFVNRSVTKAEFEQVARIITRAQKELKYVTTTSTQK